MQTLFASLRRREQIFAGVDTKHFVGMIGQVLRSNDMTRQSAYQLLGGPFLACEQFESRIVLSNRCESFWRRPSRNAEVALHFRPEGIEISFQDRRLF